METQGFTYVERGQVKHAPAPVQRVKVLSGFMLGPGKPAHVGDIVTLPVHAAREHIRVGNAVAVDDVPRGTETVVTRDPDVTTRDPEIQRRAKR